MIRLIQRRLIIPRGDTGTFTVPVISAKNTGDVAVFSIIDNLTERKVFEKIVEVSGDTMTIEFSHNDTVNLPVGKYVWDIKFYSNPVFVDGALVDGVEVDSYYAAFTLPICEIRQTGDNLLMADDAPDTELTPSQLNILNATVNETNAAKRDAAASASAAEASATAAASSANEALISAGNAADSATSAAASAADAATTKGQVDVLAAQVAADATTAVNAKNDAIANATSASTSATAADASATIASNAATTATNKANEAYTSAGLAETAKVNAQSAASAASTSAASAQAAANEIKNISAEATTLQPNSNATATYNSSTGKLTFGIPRGNGITSAVMNNDYTLTLTYTNGNTFTTPPLKGEQGDAFHIVKTYGSIAAMNADYNGNDVEVGEFVMIASTVEDPDNAKVYVKGDQQYNFVIDMSGASGINGVGISSIQKTSTSGKVDTYTITYTDNTSTNFNVVNGEDGSEYTVLVQSTQPTEENNKLWIPTTSGVVQQVPTVEEMNAAIASIDLSGYATKAEVPVEYGSGVGAIQGKEWDFNSSVKATPSANGNGSFAVGFNSIASGPVSFASGGFSEASGQCSYAEGVYTKAIGPTSHAEGQYSEARGAMSHAEGNKTIATGDESHVSGHYNIEDSYNNWPEWEPGEYAVGDKVKVTTTVNNETTVTGYICKTANNDATFTASHWIKDTYINYAEIIGNGKYNARSNARALDWDGNEHLMGDVYVGCNPDSSGGTKLAKETAIASLDASIAPTETAATATAAHAVGELFMMGETLMVALSAIAIGDTITTEGANPNAAVTTLASKLIKDIQVNGTSIVQDGVANVPVATNSTYGVLRCRPLFGIDVSEGWPYIVTASNAEIKRGDQVYKPIISVNQHLATFYGLAKAAGADMKDISGNAASLVGTYPEAQKSAISQMLNGPVTVSGTTPAITALPGVRYVCGEVATLDITLPASGCVDVVFESGSTATVLTITPPSGVTVKWANGFDPTALEANTTYEINIMDGLGVAGSWT